MFNKILTNNSAIDISRLDLNIIRMMWKNVIDKNQCSLLNCREQILLHILAPNKTCYIYSFTVLQSDNWQLFKSFSKCRKCPPLHLPLMVTKREGRSFLKLKIINNELRRNKGQKVWAY